MNREKAAQILNLPLGEKVTTILPLGYPKKIPKPTSRKTLSTIVQEIE